MEFTRLVHERASTRAFTSDPVPVADLREFARLAGRCPSVNNSQPWRFIAITDKALLTAMAVAVRERLESLLPAKADAEAKRIVHQVIGYSTFFDHAPAVFAIATRPYEAVADRVLLNSPVTHGDMNRLRGQPDVQSLGAAALTILLAAQDMGYGACWLSGPLVARDALEAFLRIEAPWRLGTMIAVGKPAHVTAPTERKPIGEIFELMA
jgi:nitroreductase